MNGTGGDQHNEVLGAAKEKEDEGKDASMPPKPMSTNPEDLTTRGLRFLSTASTETIGGIAVGFAACTYLVLGRVGLVLIGALGGVVLHATWEGQSSLAGSIKDARKEKGLDIVKRLLDLRDSAAKSEDDDDDDDDDDKQAVGNNFEGFRPETAAALTELVDAVIRDYVKWWYHPIIPKDQSFPAASRQTLTRFLLSISQHLSRKRPADSFLDFLTHSSSMVIVFLNELSSALATSQGANVPAAEAVYTYLSANPESNLASILNEKQQSKKFKMIAEDILENFLEKQAYDCDPARIFLREILGGIVLEMSLKSCSKPEWINGWIVYLLEDGEPDFSQAIDAGMSSGNDLISSPFNDLDGNVGNVGLAKPSKMQKESQKKQEAQRHKKRLSKAEEAMEEAMEEAKRLSQLIAEEDAKKAAGQQMSAEEKSKALVTAVEQSIPSPGSNAPKFPNSTSDTVPPLRPSKDPRQDTLIELLQQPETQKPILREVIGSEAIESTKPLEPLEATDSQGTQSQTTLDSPVSPRNSSKPIPSSQTQSASHFTSFDQIVPQSTPVALQEGSPLPRRKTGSLTLHNAGIAIYDDSTLSDKGKLRSKPTGDYLVQIEPASSRHPGWMIVRRYPDFETLHEVLRRIAQVAGVTAFTEQHHTLPGWKEHTKTSLRGELERYLRDALWYQPLAESEGMKRFLEKDQGQSVSGSGTKNGFPGIGWPTPSAFETMGKGMLDVLTSAPKGVAEGGKVIGGGITGVFSNIGNLGQKKPNNNPTNIGMHTAGRSSTSTLPRSDSVISVTGSRKGRASEDSLRPTSIIQTQPSTIPPMERRPSHNSIAEDENEREPRVSTSARSSMSGRRSENHSRDPSRAPSRRGTPLQSPIHGTIDEFKLPPPPSDMPDDYGSAFEDSSAAHSRTESFAPTTRTSTSTAPSPATHSRNESIAPRTSTSTAPSQLSPARQSLSIPRRPSMPLMQRLSSKPRKDATPLTGQETGVAVELLFAVINELYTLSSAWNIRRTLLTAAKTFLLRPGNPSLSSIQSLIQDSVIAANTSDSGIAAHLRKLRENTMPTEEELKAWPPEMSSEEKERLRIKARKLLVERGVPAALTGVMGQAATSEAMGRVFDCLQVEEVARGLIFGLLLQGVRAITH